MLQQMFARQSSNQGFQQPIYEDLAPPTQNCAFCSKYFQINLYDRALFYFVSNKVRNNKKKHVVEKQSRTTNYKEPFTSLKLRGALKKIRNYLGRGRDLLFGNNSQIIP